MRRVITRYPKIIAGPAYKSRRTKALMWRAERGSIAVIAHRDIDTLAAEGLIDLGATAVINIEASISGRYPAEGASLLLAAGIPLLDAVPALWDLIEDGQQLTIDLTSGAIACRGRRLAVGRVWTTAAATKAMAAARKNFRHELDCFVENTLLYAQQQKEMLISSPKLPPLHIPVAGKHVLVVVRGKGYREDLRAISHYIRELKPVLIGVDGGADAVLEIGLRPDVVLGDMDSVSDQALRAAKQLIVHAYPDGRAPGMARLERLQLSGDIFPCPGTSEDAALLLAYEGGARLIVAVGTHTHIFDFLEKGRAGMASTLLVRAKVGERLVDAKGVSQLYRQTGARYVGPLAIAALMAATAVVVSAPLTRLLVRLAWIEFRFILGL